MVDSGFEPVRGLQILPFLWSPSCLPAITVVKKGCALAASGDKECLREGEVIQAGLPGPGRPHTPFPVVPQMITATTR